MRDTFEIHSSIERFGIKVTVELDGNVEFITTVRDDVTRATLLVTLEDKKAKLLAADTIKLSGRLISIKGPAKFKKATRPRSGKQKEDAENFKELVTQQGQNAAALGAAATAVGTATLALTALAALAAAASTVPLLLQHT